MDYKIEEIASILIQQIKGYEPELEVETESRGTVTYVGDGIARARLEGVMAGELLEFPGGVYGMALNLEEDSVGAAILGPYFHIKEGDEVKHLPHHGGAQRGGAHRQGGQPGGAAPGRKGAG